MSLSGQLVPREDGFRPIHRISRRTIQSLLDTYDDAEILKIPGFLALELLPCFPTQDLYFE